MIYALPYNESIQGKLPPLPSSKDVERFIRRVTIGLTSKGYVIGPKGVYLGPMGEIMADTDRDPRADWSSVSLPDKTPEDQQAADDLVMVQTALPKLKAGTIPATQLANIERVIGWLVEQEFKRMGLSS